MTFGKNFMNGCFPKLSQQQKDVLLEWEAMLCEPADAERLAAQPALQRQLDRLVAVLERRFKEYAALRKPSVKAIFDVQAADRRVNAGVGGHALRACGRGALGGSAGASAATGQARGRARAAVEEYAALRKPSLP